MRLNIKPLSINKAWIGKLRKTKAHKDYIKAVFLMLRPFKVPSGELELYLKWGFSSRNSDFDNPTKIFVDILQAKYEFNDKMIKRCIIEVEQVKRGKEFIEWDIKKINKNK